MDPTVLAGMIFVLIVIGMIGGFTILAPIALRLGKLLERRLEQRLPEDKAVYETRELKREIAALQEELGRISQRQDFIENLLERPSRSRIELPESPPPQPEV